MTVGLVVAGHSRPLARAVAALASEMTPGRPVRIEVAAGLDEETFGTDAVAISEAVAAADDGDGVVVLMDLGSAVLSAETALELLDDELRERVVLCPGPLVEGLVAAVVTAGAGGSREEVAAEALAGLAGKEAHFGTAGAEPSRTGEGLSAVVRVLNEHGLHARPAARLVGELRGFDARVELRNETTDSGWVPASSLTRVATLGALRGHDLAVRASGPQAREAVDRLVALAADAFGEAQDRQGVAAGPVDHDHVNAQDYVNQPKSGPALHRGSPTTGNYPPSSRSLPKPCGQPGNVDNPTTAAKSGITPRAVACSPGTAIGAPIRLEQPKPNISDEPSQGSEAERQRLDDALAKARYEIGQLSGDIFQAHRMLLEDADLLDEAHARIGEGATAPRAWREATNRAAAEFDALPDPYLRARADDVRAVSDQVLRALLGVPAATVDGEGILMATDLTPAQAAALDPVRIAGVVLRNGSPTSHAAILLRTRGIPAVIGDIPEGALIAFDGSTGEVAVDPVPEVLADFRARAERQRTQRDDARTKAAQPAVTRGGMTIHVGANIGSVAEAHVAAENGADLAGLVRTEFLFLDRDTAPDADEQEAVYQAIADALGGRRITLRTLDAGSDKPLPYLPTPSEANPFLGVRGIRHSLTHRAMFVEQLRAIVRVAHRTPVSVMFPMVTALDEVIEARRMLEEAGGGKAPGLRVGMMVEVPAAALRASIFTPYVDFFSIGTNDLTQYTLAAERGNADLLALTSGLDPAVEQLVQGVCRAAGQETTVAVCGELAADETVVPRLLAAGVRELSVAPALVPLTKQAVRAT